MKGSLSNERITELSNRPGVKRLLVQNFLGTLRAMDKNEALKCMRHEAELYEFNSETDRAIKLGIYEAFFQPSID